MIDVDRLSRIFENGLSVARLADQMRLWSDDLKQSGDGTRTRLAKGVLAVRWAVRHGRITEQCVWPAAVAVTAPEPTVVAADPAYHWPTVAVLGERRVRVRQLIDKMRSECVTWRNATPEACIAAASRACFALWLEERGR